MQTFDCEQPQWGRIAPLRVTGTGHRIDARTAGVPTSAGVLQISLHPYGARLRCGDSGVDAYGMLATAAGTVAHGLAHGLSDGLNDRLSDGLNDGLAQQDLQISAEAGATVVSGAGFTLRIDHDPLSFALLRGEDVVQCSPSDGHFVRKFRLPPFARVDGGWFVSLELHAGEPVYGLGEKWGKLDRRGQLLRSFNRDALGVNGEWSYKNAPFAWSPRGWGAFVHTAGPVTHGVGHAPWSQRAYGLWIEDEALDLFLLAGEDGGALIGHYTALTGRAPVPPLWSLGVILSKAYYTDSAELLSVAREVRERRMPCDVITLDGRAWQDTDTRFAFEWDAKRYPQPAVVLNELKQLGFKVCVWEYPLISVKNPLHAELEARGWLLKDRRSGSAYRFSWDPEPFGQVLTALPDSGLLDFTHPQAFAYWRDRHAALYELGVDMIKADFGEQIADDVLAANGATGRALHNVYALLYNRCVYEAAQRYAPNGPFLFSRAAWTGQQRYPSQWGGDPQADWGGLGASLRGGLSWGMTGGPFYATDVGGFYGDTRDAQLYARWAQAAVYSAHFRMHGIGPREPWSYGPQAQAAATAALQLRYRLLPYLYRAMEQASRTGLPVQRAMALAFPGERASWNFEEQFMCGDDLLVAPCLDPRGQVEVYLPAGQWHRFPNGGVFAGGRVHSLQLRLDETAVFARSGARIPLGPEIENTLSLQGVAQVAAHWCDGASV